MDLLSRLFKYFLYVFLFLCLSSSYRSTTREQYLIANGTNDKMPNINVWEKQVDIYIYIYIWAHTNDFQEESIYWAGMKLQMQLIYSFNYGFDFA